MLSASRLRRATSSLRRCVDHSSSSPTTPLPLRITVATASLYKKNSSLGEETRDTGIEIHQSTPIDIEEPHAARETFAEIQRFGGYMVTEKVSSTLLNSFVKLKQVEDSVDLLQCWQEQKVSPNSSACAAAFTLFCNNMQEMHALRLFETMFENNSKVRHWVYGRAFHLAVKWNRQNIEEKIIHQLLGE